MNRKRVTLSEEGDVVSLASMAEMIAVSVGVLREFFVESSGRLRHDLRLREEPFIVTKGGVCTNGIAGVTRLAPGVEVEIVPKCFDPDWRGWIDDFLVMAAVTKLGRVFRREQVSASLRVEHKDVMTLLAAVFLQECERLSRVPIREYQRSSWTNANVEGEFDYTEMWAVQPEGFHQIGIRLSVNNQFMGMIGGVARYLAGVSSDRGIGQRLRRLASGFPDQVAGRTRGRVPGRYARWQPLYDLAVAIRSGFGVQLRTEGALRAPSFVLNTERGWEDMLALALTTQGNVLRVRVKPASKLGSRHPGMQDVLTYPDFVLNPPLFGGSIVVDAKYKGTSAKPITRISASDLYEALAFLEARQSSIAVLVYPGGELSSGEVEPGTLEPFDEVVIGSRRVIGAGVSISGIGRTHGLVAFGRRLGRCLVEISSQRA